MLRFTHLWFVNVPDLCQQLQSILGRTQAVLWYHQSKGPNVMPTSKRNHHQESYVSDIWHGSVARGWKKTLKPGSDVTTWFTTPGAFELFFILFLDGFQPFEGTAYGRSPIWFRLI